MKLIYPWVIAVGVVVLIGLAVFGRKKKSTYKEGKKVANTDFIEETQLYQKLKRQYHIFSTMALLCLFIAIVCGFVLLSRPARVEQVNTELRNRDIFLCMDVSVSMDELNVEMCHELTTGSAILASERPMSMMTGPTTTGGNMRLMKSNPRKRTKALMMAYTAPTADSPDSVPGSP